METDPAGARRATMQRANEERTRHMAVQQLAGAYLASPARRPRPNLSTPEAWWGQFIPPWAHSSYHLAELPPIEAAVLGARESLYRLRSRGAMFDFAGLSEGCLSGLHNILARPILDNDTTVTEVRRVSRKARTPMPYMTGPVKLLNCLRACKRTPGCGAIAFLLLQRKGRSDQGLCVFKNKQCLHEGTVRVGLCPQTNEWCSFKLLHRRPPPFPPEQLRTPSVVPSMCKPARLTPVPLHNWSAGAGASAEGNVATAAVSTRSFYRTDVVLGGGLNNMLMNVAQMLDMTCSANNSALVMPLLDADPLWMFDPKDGTQQKTKPRPLRFDHLFDWTHFARRVAPCVVVLEPPSGANVILTQPKHLTLGWSSPSIFRAIEKVYAALSPNGAVRALIGALKREAVRRAGDRWTAVHMPIENDWCNDPQLTTTLASPQVSPLILPHRWFTSNGWCASRKLEDHTRRCFTPAEVANLTSAVRRDLNSTGTVLLFAHEKVNSRGPSLCLDAFGERAVKLALDRFKVSYLYRNAAEEFLAADAPAGFLGNSYSTFSKSVALLRSAHLDLQLRKQSWAYDCALPDSRHRWFPVQATESIVANHPGFARLDTLPGHCQEANPLGGSQLPTSMGVAVWCFTHEWCHRK